MEMFLLLVEKHASLFSRSYSLHLEFTLLGGLFKWAGTKFARWDFAQIGFVGRMQSRIV